MRKNKINYILCSLLSFVIFSYTVRAVDLGYTYYPQSYKGQTMYCVDGGYHPVSEANINNACSFGKIENEDVLNVVFNELGFSDHERQAALRQLAHNSGLTKSLKGAGQTAVNNKYIKDKLASKGIANSTLKVNNISMFDVVSITSSGGTSVATVRLVTSGPTVVTTKTGTLSQSSFGAGTHTFTLTVPSPTNCNTLEVTLTAKVTSNGTPDGSGTGGYYFIDCGSAGQNYIVKLGSAPGNGDDDSKGKARNSTFTITFTDSECDCSGFTTGLCAECNKTATSQDGKPDASLVKCADNNAFVNYCGTSIRKTEDGLDGSERYCSVYCTEKIDYNLPGELYTKAGRYFKLKQDWDIDKVDKNGNDNNTGKNITIKGTRTCVTSTINKQRYIEDIIKAQDRILTEYNKYRLAKASEYALSHTDTETLNGPDCASRDNSTNTCKTYCTYTREYTKQEDGAKYKEYDLGNYDSEGKYKGEKYTERYYSAEWITSSTCASIAVTQKPEPIPAEAGAIKAAITNMEQNVIKKYKKCADWKNNYSCFKPVIKFKYDEKYTGFNDIELPLDGEPSISNGRLEYFSSLSDEVKYTGEPAFPHESVNVEYVNANGTSVSTKQYKVNTDIKYVKVVSTGEAKFKEGPKEISTYHPYGTIKESKDCTDVDCKKIGYALPVALEHENTSGIYNYYIDFENIGMGGNDDQCNVGRINGCKNGESLTESASEGANCDTDYSCRYLLKKCPECEIKCVCPDGSTNCRVEDNVCIWDVPDNCKECEIECVGCIWDNGDTTISYKSISLDDVYKDDKEIGSNWEEHPEVIEKIEKQQQEIYDNKPMYSFTLTPGIMGKIRDYNKKSIEGKTTNEIPAGGYSSDTLTCAEYEFCESSFIRKFLPKKTDITTIEKDGSGYIVPKNK
ncbi:MAG: hypothetical protein E7158_03200 [Firmicutes bacterium]|nr:hypothetical protein [Bacillota bacterium]